MSSDNVVLKLIKLIEEQNRKIEELNQKILELQSEQANKPVVTSKLEHETESKIEVLHSPGMQRAIDKILSDWNKVKNRF